MIDIERQRLLNQIASIKSSKRKPRSDKGKKRDHYNLNTEVTPVHTYNRIRSRLQTLDKISTDDNGYYLVLDRTTIPIYGEFKNGTVKYSTSQNHVNLEEYRFKAWQYNAINHSDEKVPLPNGDLQRWAYECGGLTYDQALEFFRNKSYTWLQLFCEFYHIIDKEASLWTFDQWYSDYNRTPKQELDSDFKFSIDFRPGTPEFHSEFTYVVEEQKRTNEQLIAEKRDRRIWAAKVGRR